MNVAPTLWTTPPSTLHQAASAQRAALASDIGHPRDEPPPKKRRLDHGNATAQTPPSRPANTAPKRTLKECLRAHVLPSVRREINKLPKANVAAHVHEIAVNTVTAIAKLPRFKQRYNLTAGFLTPDDEKYVSEQANNLVLAAAKQVKSQAGPPTPATSIETPQAVSAKYPRTATPGLVISIETPPELARSNSTSHDEESSVSVSTNISSSPSPRPKPSQQPSATPRSPQVPRTVTRDVTKEVFLDAKVLSPIVPTISTERSAASNITAPSRTQTISERQSSKSSWFQLRERPYIPAADRDLVAKGVRRPVPGFPNVLEEPLVYHVDFTADEVTQIVTYLKEHYEAPQRAPATIEALAQLCQTYHVPTLVKVAGRSDEDMRSFCSDLLAGKASSPDNSRILSLNRDSDQHQARRASRIPSLLFARELEGKMGFGRTRQLENFENEFKKANEDDLTVVAEFTNCAGDIAAISWVSDEAFVCGTTAHSDTHNQQYNKSGNLLLCSAAQGTLRAFADHRIPRPVVEKGENSTEAMRQSQDPWLYSSVVSSDYDAVQERAYTSSFDKTVKVWKVDKNGNSMAALGTWKHEGNVNFVVAAKDGSGWVATASDVPSEAVRIYTVNKDNIAASSYQSFSCFRTDADDGSGSRRWAYFPATIQWGRAPRAQHLLIVGYSPRSLQGDDHDIPEDRRQSGEIILWDARRGCRIAMLTATTANVFEVAWHPTLERFALATSPCGNNIEHEARTQIRLFQRDPDRNDGGYCEYQNLDCPAFDINELTFMPNSLIHAYVTAACTDGKIYVWDTSQGDLPIHVLSHGYPLDEFSGDREKEDTGIKFTAWGTSPDRFYTGGSDGVVKVWNVRKRYRPFERTLLKAPGPISCGAFSPGQSKLAVGDATGRVFLLSLDRRDELEASFIKLPGLKRKIRRPLPFTPHLDPPPPELDPDAMEHGISEATFARQTYLDSKQLVLVNNPVIGAVQGPFYAATGLFRREAHLDDNPMEPLLSQYDRQQRSSVEASRGLRRRSIRRLKGPGPPDVKREAAHRANEAASRMDDFYIDTLDPDVLDDLVRAGAALYFDQEGELDSEEVSYNY